MMSTYQVGSLCEDCFSHGLQNYLKSFYINLEEQIIKCESSKCMYPYIRRPITLQDSKRSESVLSLDDFIKESAQKIDITPKKSELSNEQLQGCSAKIEDVPIMYDFSSLFLETPVKKEGKSKTVQKSAAISCKTEDTKSSSSAFDEIAFPQSRTPPKARISRCLSNVKSTSSSSKANQKRLKSKRGKNDTVLVIEPQSGKAMRPLDLIKHYMNHDQKLLP